MEILLGFSEKYSCGLCLWDNYADDEYYMRREWTSREKLQIGTVLMNGYLLSSFLIKNYLVNKFVNALDRKGKTFIQKFERENVKEGIFNDFQIKKKNSSKILILMIS